MIIAYSGGVHPPYILAFLFDGSDINRPIVGTSSTTVDREGNLKLENTARLGVMLTPVEPFGQSKQLYARVAYAESIISFVVSSDETTYELTAVRNGTVSIMWQPHAPWMWQPLRM